MVRRQLSGLLLTEPVPGVSPLGRLAASGVYGGGLLAVPTVDDAREMIDSVEWDFARQFELIAHNAFGDLFLRSTERDAVYYLWMQWGRARQVAGNAQELFESVLMDAANRGEFLEMEAFGVVSPRLGPLRYGTVFTLNPIRALGGDGDLGSCEVGQLSVYLSIISQSFEPE